MPSRQRAKADAALRGALTRSPANVALRYALAASTGPGEIDLPKLKQALADGADPNGTAETGPWRGRDSAATPLRLALNSAGVLAGQDVGPAIEALLDAGADPQQRVHGDTPLDTAACHGHPTAIDLLVQAGAKVDAPDRHGATALHWAARQGEFECVRALLRNGANPLALDINGATPLAWACEALGARQTQAALILLSACPEALDLHDRLALTNAQDAWAREGDAMSSAEQACAALAKERGYAFDFHGERSPLPALRAAIEARELAQGIGSGSKNKTSPSL